MRQFQITRLTPEPARAFRLLTGIRMSNSSPSFTAVSTGSRASASTKSRSTKAAAQRRRSIARKYRKGSPINSPVELLIELAAGHYVMWHDRPLHPEVFKSMTLRTIMGGILKGIISRAERVADDAGTLPLPFGEGSA